MPWLERTELGTDTGSVPSCSSTEHPKNIGLFAEFIVIICFLHIFSKSARFQNVAFVPGKFVNEVKHDIFQIYILQ